MPSAMRFFLVLQSGPSKAESYGPYAIFIEKRFYSGCDTGTIVLVLLTVHGCAGAV